MHATKREKHVKRERGSSELLSPPRCSSSPPLEPLPLPPAFFGVIRGFIWGCSAKRKRDGGGCGSAWCRCHCGLPEQSLNHRNIVGRCRNCMSLPESPSSPKVIIGHCSVCLESRVN